jgi:hypothetical protein
MAAAARAASISPGARPTVADDLLHQPQRPAASTADEKAAPLRAPHPLRRTYAKDRGLRLP